MPFTILKFIFSRRTPFATAFFIILNALFYIYTCFQSGFSIEKFVQGPGYNSLVLFGGKENGLIALGQIYRFFFQFSCMQTWFIY